MYCSLQLQLARNSEWQFTVVIQVVTELVSWLVECTEYGWKRVGKKRAERGCQGWERSGYWRQWLHQHFIPLSRFSWGCTNQRAGTSLSRPFGEVEAYQEVREQVFPYFKETSGSVPPPIQDTVHAPLTQLHQWGVGFSWEWAVSKIKSRVERLVITRPLRIND